MLVAPPPPAYECAPLGVRVFQAFVAGTSVGGAAVVAWFLLGPPWGYAVVPPAVLMAAWGIRRSFRLGVVATPERVLVRNYWRTHEFSWLDVKKVTTGVMMQGTANRIVLAFWLRDGRFIRAQGTPSRLEDQRPVLEALDALAPPSVEFSEKFLLYVRGGVRA